MVWRSAAQATLCQMETHFPCPKKGQSPSIFGTCLLWPNGWIDQDGTLQKLRWASVQATLCRWRHSCPFQKGDTALIFGPFLLWPNSWMHQDATWYGGRPQPMGLCVRWGASPLQKRAEPPIFGLCLLRPNGCMDQDATWCGDKSRPTLHCVRRGPSSPSPKGALPPFVG